VLPQFNAAAGSAPRSGQLSGVVGILYQSSVADWYQRSSSSTTRGKNTAATVAGVAVAISSDAAAAAELNADVADASTVVVAAMLGSYM